MEINRGKGTTEYGPGVEINLTGDEVAIAIEAYLAANGVYIDGPRTTLVNETRCKSGRIYVDPCGCVKISGRGK